MVVQGRLRTEHITDIAQRSQFRLRNGSIPQSVIYELAWAGLRGFREVEARRHRGKASKLGSDADDVVQTGLVDSEVILGR